MTTSTHLRELVDILRDPDVDRPTRLTRLQGWRGPDLACAIRAGHAHRLAPLTCAVLGWVTVLSGSVPVALATAASAAIGTFAANHPVETLYNRIAVRTGRGPIPANRAAKRLGCAMGFLIFVGAAAAFDTGHYALGTVLAATIGLLASLVALSNVCIPSLVFTLVFGAQRATATKLFSRPQIERPAPVASDV